MRILIIEDEQKTAGYLNKGLSEHGYVADVANNGEEGLSLARNGDYGLIILDVMIPGRDGWSVLQQLRSEGRQTPVLFLTARDGVDDRVKGLQLGADDYLLKPFAFAELLARVQSILRRSSRPLEPGADHGVIKVADLEIDLLKHRAMRAGKRIELTPKEFSLLSFLAGRAGEALSRTLIAGQVWDMNFDTDSNVVDVHVRRLRAKMDDSFEPKLIHTVRGVGYVLESRA